MQIENNENDRIKKKERELIELRVAERKKKAVLLLAVAALFFLSACIASTMDERDWRRNSEKGAGALVSPNQSEYDDGPCLCSQCTGGATTHSFLGVTWGDMLLRNAQCEFIACDFQTRDAERVAEGGAAVFTAGATGTRHLKDENDFDIELVTVTSVESLAENEDTVKLPFMFGQGGTFTEAEYAQEWCNGQFQLAVKWLEGGEATLGSGATMKYAPPQPYKKQAECFLDLNIIPVYIWYTRGTSLDYNKRSNHEYAAKLNGVGPVIVTPEAMYDSANAGVVNKVKDQLAGIQDDCPNCLVMLVPREANGEDYLNSIKAVINEVDTLHNTPSDQVDLIGKIVVVDDTHACDFGQALEKAKEDAKQTMKKFRKPTILLFYMQYDDLSSPFDGGCDFTVGQAANEYAALAEGTHNQLLPNGIIGVVPMQLQDRKPTPDYIVGRDYGFAKGIRIEAFGAKNPALKAWFNRCRMYYKQEETTVTPERNGYWQSLMITSYQGKSGSYCEAGNNFAVQAANAWDKTNPYDFDLYQETTTPHFDDDLPQVNRTGTEKCVEKLNYAPRTGPITSDWGMMALRSKYAITTIIPLGGFYVNTLNYKIAVKTAAEKCDIDESLLRALLSKSGELTFTDASVLDPGNANYKVGVICAYWQKELDSITKWEGGGGAGFKPVTDEALMKRIKQKAAFFTALDYAMNELHQIGDGTLVVNDALRSNDKFYEEVCLPPAPPPPADGSTPPATTVPVGHGIYYPCLVIDTYNQDYPHTRPT